MQFFWWSAPVSLDGQERRLHSASMLALGLATALLNPVAFAFFAAQYLGPLRNANGITMFGVFTCVPMVNFTYALAAAALLCRPPIRARVTKSARAIQLLVAMFFFVIAAARLPVVLAR